MKFLYYSFMALISMGFIAFFAGVIVVAYVFQYYGQDLPDYSSLKNYVPPVVTRVYTGDGQLMAEFASEKRIYMPIETIPDKVKQAFIAAEDKNFYTHKGVDYLATARAVVRNIQALGSGRRPQGASTITQQVAKNFLLSSEVSYERKIKEALLAYRMEQAMTKDRLLELYLNEIFLGKRSYGVAAAALNYFNKSLKDLTLAEAAFLGALPKAPNNYQPDEEYQAALARRNWVLSRMEVEGFITEGQAALARATPIETVTTENKEKVSAPYFAEEVRRLVDSKYGADSLYKGGLVVTTSIDPTLQLIATKALRDGLMAYDRRHGWRGPVVNFDSFDNWQERLANLGPFRGQLSAWSLGLLLNKTENTYTLGLQDGTTSSLKKKGNAWAFDKLEKGDVVYIENVAPDQVEPVYEVRQIPEVQGAIVAMDPHTGRVLAMQGGWMFKGSEFNRATQAQRQPGSAFKPFVYLTALEKGFTPATLILDAPIVLEQSPGKEYRPTNYAHDYYGPTTIRVGIEKSRNLMTVRLADYIGMEQITDIARRFGIDKNMQPLIANALGASETTVLDLTNAYAQLVNGGKRVRPSFVDRVQDRWGRTIYAQDTRECPSCGPKMSWAGQGVPIVPDTREQVIDERYAYQMVSILEGVVERGTGQKLKSLGRPIAGKTGTTNESKDAWFVGFTPNLAVGVYVGFDDPKSLGARETGSSAALPIFKQFMESALQGQAPLPFRAPKDVRHVRINAETGARAMPGDEKVIWEAFVAGTEPNPSTANYVTPQTQGYAEYNPYEHSPEQEGNVFVIDSEGVDYIPIINTMPEEAATIGTGGLY